MPIACEILVLVYLLVSYQQEVEFFFLFSIPLYLPIVAFYGCIFIIHGNIRSFLLRVTMRVTHRSCGCVRDRVILQKLMMIQTIVRSSFSRLEDTP